MEVQLLKDCPAGKAGRKISGPSVWRLCFPVKGCVAKPVDAEAAAAVKADLTTIRGAVLERAIAAMAAAGSLPPEPEPETPKPVAKPAKEPEEKPEPLAAPAARQATAKSEPAKTDAK